LFLYYRIGVSSGFKTRKVIAIMSTTTRAPDTDEDTSTPLLSSPSTSDTPLLIKSPPSSNNPNTALLFQTYTRWLPFLFLTEIHTGLDETLITTATLSIGSTFHTLSHLSLLGTSFFIGILLGYLIFPTLGTLFSRRCALLCTHLSYLTGIVLASFAPSWNVLILGRWFQGLGAGGELACLSIVIADTFEDLGDRARWEGVGYAVFAVTSCVGEVLGGAITEIWGWRWVYRVQVPGMAVSLLGVWWFFPEGVVFEAEEEEGQRKSIWQRLMSHNLLGAAAVVGATAALYIGLDAGSTASYAEPSAYVSLILSVLGYAVFIVSEYTHPDPIIPHTMLQNRALLAVLLLNFLVMGSQYMAMYYVPVFYQAVSEASALRAGLYMVPGAVATLVVCAGAGRWIGDGKRGLRGLLVGSVALAIWGNLGFAGVGWRWSTLVAPEVLAYAVWMAADAVVLLCATIALSEFMRAFSYFSAFFYLSFLSSHHNANFADSHVPSNHDTTPYFRAMFLARGSGSGLGIAVSSCIVQGSLKSMLGKIQPSLGEDMIRDLRQSLNGLGKLAESQQRDVRWVYGRAIVWAMGFGVAELVACWGVAWWMGGKKIREGAGLEEEDIVGGRVEEERGD
jgi:MFS family permease